MFKLLAGIDVETKDLDAVAFALGIKLEETPQAVIARMQETGREMLNNAREVYRHHLKLKGDADGTQA